MTTGYKRAAYRSQCPPRAPDLVYVTSDGYRCWRWRPDGIEMLEHRFLLDPGPGLHVHHRNGDTLDNRRSNLVTLTPSQHRKEHRTVTDEDLVALHVAGLTTVAIGSLVGLHHSQVSRRLRAAGQRLGPRSTNRVEMDQAEVLRRHDAGERASWIAEALNVPTESVRRVLRQNGRRGRSGRPTSGSRL